jgi:ABC-2 type transport system ATP-binding protein
MSDSSAATDTAFDVRGLTKRYGDFTAVDDLSIAIPRGSVCALLGPNGAGKTSTFKCLLGFAQPSAGTILIDGRPLEPATFERLAFVPEKPALFENMTIAEHLEMYRRVHATYDAARAGELLALFELEGKKKVKRLSKGMRTATGIVLAFSLRPSLMVLDEPTSGLDPIHQRQVLDLIIDASASGATILFASHQISQVERAADRVAVIKRGKLVLYAEADALRSQERLVQAMFDGPVPSLNGLASDPRVRKVEQTGRLLRLYVSSDSEGVATALTALGARSVDVTELGLEDVFMNLMGDGK